MAVETKQASQMIADEISGPKSSPNQTVRFLDSRPTCSKEILEKTLWTYGLGIDATVADVDAAREVGRIKMEKQRAEQQERHEAAMRAQAAKREVEDAAQLSAKQYEYGLPSTATWSDVGKARDEEIARQQAAAVERNRTQKIEALWRESSVPQRHRDKVRSFTGPAEWIAKLGVAWGIVNKGGLVALIGKRGNGKTQIAVECVRRSCEAEHSAYYLKAMDFFVRLRATFHKESVEDEVGVLDQLTGYSLLVLDNVDRRGSSEWEDRLLTHLIDRRYDRCVGTILIANLEEAAFAEHVGVDVVDRIRDGGGLIVADWPSFRGA